MEANVYDTSGRKRKEKKRKKRGFICEMNIR